MGHSHHSQRRHLVYHWHSGQSTCLTDIWRRVCGDDTAPFLIADYQTREIMRGELVKRMGLMEARRLEAASRRQPSEEHWDMHELWPWRYKD